MSDESVIMNFWVLLSYFVAFVCLVCSYRYGVQEWVYYGLFFILFGLGLNISYNLVIVRDLLLLSDVEFDFVEDSD